MNPLPSREGYRQLGYIIARSMAIRDERKRPDSEEVAELLRVMVEMEAWPEAWKLARFAGQQSGPGTVAPEILASIHRGWKTCQYAKSMRWALEKGVL